MDQINDFQSLNQFNNSANNGLEDLGGLNQQEIQLNVWEIFTILIFNELVKLGRKVALMKYLANVSS